MCWNESPIAVRAMSSANRRTRGLAVSRVAQDNGALEFGKVERGSIAGAALGGGGLGQDVAMLDERFVAVDGVRVVTGTHAQLEAARQRVDEY